jgi:predicted RNA-binding protein with TRAM domain
MAEDNISPVSKQQKLNVHIINIGKNGTGDGVAKINGFVIFCAFPDKNNKPIIGKTYEVIITNIIKKCAFADIIREVV